MPFKPGQSGNPAGRKAGSVGERSKENLTRAVKFIKMIESHPKFDQVMLSLEPFQLARLYKDMIEFIEPRLSRVQHTDPDGNTVQINVNVRANTNQPESSQIELPKAEPISINQDSDLNSDEKF